MKIVNASTKQIAEALEYVNKKFDDNIDFKQLDSVGKRKLIHNVSLRVLDSKKSGARIGAVRRTKSACWHVHGEFFDKLFDVNPEIEITAMGRKITADRGNWVDENLGTKMHPRYASEACDCNKVKAEGEVVKAMEKVSKPEEGKLDLKKEAGKLGELFG